ncbi:MAG TPA: hypothetical protein VF220_10675 [Nitrososphaeraceae archaeon]
MSKITKFFININRDPIELEERLSEKNEDTRSGASVSTGDVTGAGIIVGSNITTGNITIGDTKIEINNSLNKNPNSEYLEALKNLMEKLEVAYAKEDVPEDKKTEINKAVITLQEDVKDLKPGTKADDLSPPQQDKIKADTSSLIDKLLDASPAIAETITKFTPLAPFDNLIREGVQKLADGIKELVNI